MTQPLLPAMLSDVLDALEDRELPLLSWGVTTGALAHDEVTTLIDDMIDEGRVDALRAADVIQQLLTDGLLMRVPNTSPPRYRTRIAETLRLTTQLRQLFVPPNVTSPAARWWERGRPLVADYRLHVAARRYPMRNIPPDDVQAELREAGWSAMQTAAAAAQINGRELSRFQVQATTAVSRALSSGTSRGVIVGAGTGSGKTLAFYLPAMAAIAESAQPGLSRLHTIAVYPRNELLRDQLREAITAGEQISDALHQHGRRPLRLGALYGDTPRHPGDRRLTGQARNGGWLRGANGAICPYLKCPRCGGDLVWPDAERTRQQPREILVCATRGHRIDGQLALTRESLTDQPPDILFTTTEMLNRNGSDRQLGRLLGWQGVSGPSLVLLDEVHTYTGVHGAQVALLLRRWRQAVRRPVTFVGLSATLRNAGAFFAELTGLDEIAIDHIEPQPSDLEDLGRQYAVALRGDPVSGAGLLSVSIQTIMLYARVLNIPGRDGLFGSRAFVFTDALDVSNRLYDDLRDAEGVPRRFGRGRGASQVLAGLRSPDAPQWADRFADGQSWDLVRQIGHPLSPTADANGLRVGRTTSQDTGVDRDADVVVATASLEVGFNDERVGLVMQHKAPRDPAAFIQRQGRAGRRREMRPITVVTLSDFGRDRLAYQAYDTLFMPEITPRHLPIGNRYVLRIQAAQALLDWLGRKLALSGVYVDPRRALTAPPPGDPPRQTREKEEALADLLAELLDRPGLQDELANHLRFALRISNDEATALLWEQPRALLLGVVPTALRRLRSEWRPSIADPGANDGDLLPEYLTSTLFKALNVPEVRLRLPFQGAMPETMSIEAALREAVPGRVSRRFGFRSQGDRTWIPLPTPSAGRPGIVDIASFVPTPVRQGQWRGPSGPITVLRPQTIDLSEPLDNVADQSQGTPEWMSEITPPNAPLIPGSVPALSTWAEHITSVGFATHAAGNPAEVRRMTYGAQCDTHLTNGQQIATSVRYEFEGIPAALGFSLGVDGIRFTLGTLNLAEPAIAAHLASPAWRRIAFVTALQEDRRLDEVANIFQRTWIISIYLTAFVLTGIESGQESALVHKQLTNGAWATNVGRILQALYRDTNASGTLNPPQRLITTLQDLSADPRVRACVDRHAELLWCGDIAARTQDLAQRSYRDTMAAALLAACQRACPDTQDTDLIVDVVAPDTANQHSQIWLTETTIGGLGIVEQLASYYAQDPRRFWGLVDSALAPGDLEYIDATLTALIRNIVNEPSGDIAATVRRLRNAANSADADSALADLRSAWAALDGSPRHAAVAALSTRLLRPGSGDDTDRMTHTIMQAWADLEARLGLEIDPQIIAYAAAEGRVPGIAAGTMTADQVFSVLWPRGNRARTAHLDHYQPYAQRPVLDRLLAAAVHGRTLPTVDVTADDWRDTYRAALTVHNAVELMAPTSAAALLAGAVREVPCVDIERDVLRVYGEVNAVRRIGAQLRVRVELREAVQ
ncbi:DEAD/DEAH box helicase [Streptosporangiaceae bacterium NEAU-GS5]|nr:DEAD/DEAH box helicase [Streptosporangiaceae bacterium NEAU-GS5]